MGLFRNIIRVDTGAYFAGAILLMLLPIQWFSAFLLAAVFHELGHLAAILLAGGKVLEVRIGAAGARITAAPQAEMRNLLCSLAGPAASLSLLLFAHVFPRLAICGFLQGIYNLLPFPAMDGGRILKSLRFLVKIPCKPGKQALQ